MRRVWDPVVRISRPYSFFLTQFLSFLAFFFSLIYGWSFVGNLKLGVIRQNKRFDALHTLLVGGGVIVEISLYRVL